MITSVHNPRVQAVRKLLAQPKARREQGEFVIEGVRLSEEALHGRLGGAAGAVHRSAGRTRSGSAGRLHCSGDSAEQVSSAVMNAHQ